MKTKDTNTKTLPLYLRPSFVVVVLTAICGYAIFNQDLSLMKLLPYLVGGVVIWVIALGIKYNKDAAEDEHDS